MVSYAPGSLATYATSSTTLVTADATNLVTPAFTVPASGNILVMLSAQTHTAPGDTGNLYWAVQVAGTDYEPQMLLTNGSFFRLSSWHYITGLTPGASVTALWRYAVSSGITGSFYAQGGGVPTSGPAKMIVWAA